MINFKKTLLVTVSALAISTPSIAAKAKVEEKKLPVVSDVKIDFSAYADFQAGLRKQTKTVAGERNVSNHRRGFAFYNSTALMAKISNKVNDVEYGAKIAVVPTAKRKSGASYDGSHIFLESDYGRFEAGSPFSAASMMVVDAGDIGAGAGNNWSRYVNTNIGHLKGNSNVEPSFATNVDFVLDDKLTTSLDNRSYTTEPPRSIAYYTPKFALTESTKVQVGASYTPDSSNTGADSLTKNSSGTETKTIDDGGAINKFVLDSTVKNAVTGGVSIEQNIADGVDLKVAFTGEAGKSAGSVKQYATANDADPQTTSLKGLRTYNIGTVLNVGNFSYAGSYGSLGKSLTSPLFHKTGRKTSYCIGAVAYKQGPFAVSVSYFKGTKFKNKTDAVSVGTNYQLAPGFKPYAQITSFTLKGRPEYNPELPKKTTRGTVALIGAKLSL
ncbi:MAG: porin [Rickettsiaceae bacterium]|nr:porin [Rickettsiaceae bacterium]